MLEKIRTHVTSGFLSSNFIFCLLYYQPHAVVITGYNSTNTFRPEIRSEFDLKINFLPRFKQCIFIVMWDFILAITSYLTKYNRLIMNTYFSIRYGTHYSRNTGAPL